MKKFLIALTLTFISFNALAKSGEHIDFKLTKPWQGIVFLCGTYSEYKEWRISVAKTLDDGVTPSDPVRVDCNAKEYKLRAGESMVCYPNWVDQCDITMLDNDFKNGSKGTYDSIPK